MAHNDATLSSWRENRGWISYPPQWLSLDHFIGLEEHRVGNRDVELLSRLEVDDQVKLGGLLHVDFIPGRN